VRDFQLRLPQNHCSIQDEIEIQRPRRVWKRPLTPGSPLDIQKRVEKLVNVQRRVAHHCRIQEPWLNAGHPDRLGFHYRRRLEVIEKSGEVLLSKVNVSLTIAEI